MQKTISFEEYIKSSISSSIKTDDLTFPLSKLEFNIPIEFEGIKIKCTRLWSNTMLSDEYGSPYFESKEKAIEAANQKDDTDSVHSSLGFMYEGKLVEIHYVYYTEELGQRDNRDWKKSYEQYVKNNEEFNRKEEIGSNFLELVKSVIDELGIKYIRTDSDHLWYSSVTECVNVCNNLGISYTRDELELKSSLNREQVKSKLIKYDEKLKKQITYQRTSSNAQ